MPEALSLRALQRQVWECLRAGDAGVLDEIALGRPDVYVHMYRARLHEVLGDVYPSLRGVSGEDTFARLCDDHLQAHPSRHPSLRHMGAQMSAWLRTLSTLPTWWADLAALEWARYDVFDEQDAPLMMISQLGAIPPERFPALPMRLVPAHRLLHAEHAVESIWRAVRDGNPWSPPDRTDGALLVWRQGRAIYHRRLEPLEARAWPLVMGGVSFGALCEELATDPQFPDLSQSIFRMLGRWVTDELLVAP